MLENLKSVILNTDVWLQSFHNTEKSTSWNIEYIISHWASLCPHANMEPRWSLTTTATFLRFRDQQCYLVKHSLQQPDLINENHPKITN